MSNSTPEPEQQHDQDAEPSLNAPEEGRPDGVEPPETNDETNDDTEEDQP